MGIKHCEDCRYKPTYLFWADTCKKKVTVVRKGVVVVESINIEDNNGFYNCCHYRPTFWKILCNLFTGG